MTLLSPFCREKPSETFERAKQNYNPQHYDSKKLTVKKAITSRHRTNMEMESYIHNVTKISAAPKIDMDPCSHAHCSFLLNSSIPTLIYSGLKDHKSANGG